MKKIKTYWWFWGLIPVFLFFSFVLADSQLDISNEMWDKSFPLNCYGIPLSIFLFLSGFGYLFNYSKFNPVLTKLHLLSVVTGLFLLVLPKIMFLSSPPRRYYTNTSEIDFSEFIKNLNGISNLGITLIILGTIAYLINIGFAIFKNKT